MAKSKAAARVGRRPVQGARPGAVLPLLLLLAAPVAAQRGGSFTLDQVLSYPYPQEVVAAPTGERIAWVFNEQGVRNIYVAEAPDWKARKVTPYTEDDGQELTSLSFSPDGATVVYVRGGDHDSNWQAEGNLPPDPTSSPVQPKVEIWAVPAAGGAPKLLADGDAPVVSPKGDVVVYEKGRALWSMPLDGSSAGKRLFFSRGGVDSPVFSPDGSALAFVSNRGDHSFVGVFRNDSTPLEWLAPSTGRDRMPHWSPDGKRIAFVRMAGAGGAPEPLLQLTPRPWSIWTADVATGEGHEVWASPATLRGSVPTTEGGPNLDWAAGDRLVFLADLDGWPHLYSIPASGGDPMLLTPGKGMAEYVSMSPDRKYLYFCGNEGPLPTDIDRRHIVRVPVDRAAPQVLTAGEGIEWTPAVTGDGAKVAFIGAGAREPPLPKVMDAAGGKPVAVGADRIPADFPTASLVVPKQVIFHAADGTEVHGQLFERAGGPARKPGVIFVHGGPPRQMLLGWHYMDYYTNGYAVNQFLANHGYVVMSVNYRLGIGYGHEFHHPEHAGPWGASEYLDVKAGGKYLADLPEVDPQRVGIWGGSYGGFLTAMALARNSDIFAAGVDLHGVHNWVSDAGRRLGASGYEQGDRAEAERVAWESSPVASIDSWTSPVLLIQGDDDRNVQFHQTVDLAQRLRAHGIPFQELVLPDEIHGFLRHASWITADHATVAFFDRQFGLGGKAAGGR